MNPSLHGLQGQLQRITNSLLFTARPSGTDDGYKIYAESFRDPEYLHHIVEEAQTLVSDALAAPTQQPVIPSKTKLKDKR